MRVKLVVCVGSVDENCWGRVEVLRYAAHIGHWGHSFTRLFAVVRAAMWERLDLVGLLRSYGTAGGSFTLLGASHAAWLPGFEPKDAASHGTAPA